MSWGKLLLWKRVRLGNMNKLHVEWGDKKKAYHGLTGKDYTQQFY